LDSSSRSVPASRFAMRNTHRLDVAPREFSRQANLIDSPENNGFSQKNGFS